MTPKPYIVRTKFKHYLQLLHKYNQREISGFNPSGKGSDTYYIRKIDSYRAYLTKFSHLLTVYL